MLESQKTSREKERILRNMLKLDVKKDLIKFSSIPIITQILHRRLKPHALPRKNEKFLIMRFQSRLKRENQRLPRKNEIFLTRRFMSRLQREPQALPGKNEIFLQKFLSRFKRTVANKHFSTTPIKKHGSR